MDYGKRKVYDVVKWSEKYTKTDMVYLTSGGFWLIFGYVIQTITGIILATALANLLTKEAYGMYQFVISTTAVLSVFTLTGIGTSIARATAKGDEGALRYGARNQLVWSLGILVLGVTTSLYYFINDNLMLSASFLLAGLLQPIMVAAALYRSYLQGKELFKENTLVDIVQKIIPFVSIISVLVLYRNPLAIITTYFLSQTLSLSLAYLWVIKSKKLPMTRNSEIVSYAKHLSVMESLGEIASAIDKVIVWLTIGAAPTAIYALAQLPIIHMQTVFGFIRQLAFPKLAKKELQEIRRSLPQKIKIYSLMTILAVGAYIIAAPFIFKFLFPQYQESIIYSQALALSLLSIPRSLIGQVFATHKMHKELYTVNLTTPLSKIALLVPGLYFFGIWGAVSAVLISEFVSAILHWQLFRRIKI